MKIKDITQSEACSTAGRVFFNTAMRTVERGSANAAAVQWVADQLLLLAYCLEHGEEFTFRSPPEFKAEPLSPCERGPAS